MSEEAKEARQVGLFERLKQRLTGRGQRQIVPVEPHVVEKTLLYKVLQGPRNEEFKKIVDEVNAILASYAESGVGLIIPPQLARAIVNERTEEVAEAFALEIEKQIAKIMEMVKRRGDSPRDVEEFRRLVGELVEKFNHSVMVVREYRSILVSVVALNLPPTVAPRLVNVKIGYDIVQ